MHIKTNLIEYIFIINIIKRKYRVWCPKTIVIKIAQVNVTRYFAAQVSDVIVSSCCVNGTCGLPFRGDTELT